MIQVEGIFSGGGISVPRFTYTGTYEYIDDGNGNWRIKFLTSGVFTPLKDMVIEVFLVGAGAGGGETLSTPIGTIIGASSGGGGGFTKTVRSVILTKDTAYEIVVGVGGAPGVDGGSTSAFNATVSGGKKGDSIIGDKKGVAGGAGGSGGGGGSTSSDTAGSGGSDGSDGSSVSKGAGGTGQGTTTREFGEATGDLYSGGGGGATVSRTGKNAAGGDGGGAKGGESATDNTGGGGGGNGGYGGSGIVIIRNHKEAAA